MFPTSHSKARNCAESSRNRLSELMGDLSTSTTRRLSNSPVGLGVGAVGVSLGLDVGSSVGANVDGNDVGIDDGKFDGDDDGETTGLPVGVPRMIGDEVGGLEGTRVGGDVLGFIVGDNVGTFTGDDEGMNVGLPDVGGYDGEVVDAVVDAVVDVVVDVAMSSSSRKQMLALSQMKLYSQHSALVSKPLSQLAFVVESPSTQFLAP